MIGWTTTASREDALRLAHGLVEARLAACAQVSGPILSVYRWEGAVEEATEHRVTVKFAATRLREVTDWITNNHTYETPQWIVCGVSGGVQKYLNWIIENST